MKLYCYVNKKVTKFSCSALLLCLLKKYMKQLHINVELVKEISLDILTFYSLCIYHTYYNLYTFNMADMT